MATAHEANGPGWFTIREAAAYLQVGEPTIYRWMRDGRMTYRKVGDSTRFLKEDLDAVVEVFPSARDATRVTEFCPSCHHDVLVPGDLRSTGLVGFHPTQTRFWTLKDSTVKTQALMCARCGVIVLRGDPAKLAALQRTAPATPEPETPKEPEKT